MSDFTAKDLINSRGAFMPIIGKKREPMVDKMISDVVGKPIFINNPKLIALVAKYKQMKGDSDEPDNLLKNSKFIEELKATL